LVGGTSHPSVARYVTPRFRLGIGRHLVFHDRIGLVEVLHVLTEDSSLLGVQVTDVASAARELAPSLPNGLARVRASEY